MKTRQHTLLLIGCLLTPVPAHTGELTVGPRLEMTHPGKGHEVQLSGPAVAVDREGGVIVAWIAHEGHANHLYVGRPGTEANTPVHVNPEGLTVDALHQPPGIAIGPGGEIYLSWSSGKAKPEGVLFASDLRLSRSIDGGRSFDHHLRVNEDRPIAHSFEGLAAAADGTVVLSWIDSRDGWDQASTHVARIGERGTRVDGVSTLDRDTCVCCRSHIATGPNNTVAVAWRKVFSGDIRDMVVSLSHDGGQSFTPSTLVHADRWQLNACPHRGGSVAFDSRGRSYLTWYTEGKQGKPVVLFARASDGQRFSAPQRLDASTGSIPDHVRMAVDGAGRAVIVWEDATAVRRRVLLRSSSDGGRTFSPVQSLSSALKAYAPDVAVSPTGGFVVAWHEEQFPAVKTIVHRVHFKEGR
ncbi:MAG: exo-alpha-sialidase [Deltaproteobacteria bacterium]|nr:exo-alpha-sialidase [Deltaproteobacteria bacterium]